jgi:hypothetical protein
MCVWTSQIQLKQQKEHQKKIEGDLASQHEELDKLRESNRKLKSALKENGLDALKGQGNRKKLEEMKLLLDRKTTELMVRLRLSFSHHNILLK